MYVACMLLSPQVYLAIYVGLLFPLECGCLLGDTKGVCNSVFEISCSQERCQNCLLTFGNYNRALTQARQTPHHHHLHPRPPLPS